MSEPRITHELPTPPMAAPPLDHSFFKPNEYELAFLNVCALAGWPLSLRQGSSPFRKERTRTILSHASEPSILCHYGCERRNAIYPDVVERGKQWDTLFLDLGCMMGTDVRNLVKDGHPGHNVIASDLRDTYINLGFELYQDKETCPITFVIGDMFDIAPKAAAKTTPPLQRVHHLNDLASQLTHIYAGALFHLFDKATQKAIAMRLASLLEPTPGAVIFGRHAGQREEGLIDDHIGRLRYAHSPSSWEKMWKEVMDEMEGADASDKIRVHVSLKVKGPPGGIPNVDVMLFWSVQRL